MLRDNLNFLLGKIKDDETDFIILHKNLVTRFIIPTISLMTVVFILSYFSFSKSTMLGMLIVVCMAGINIFLTSKNRILKFGKFKIESRNDFADALRWLFNLLLGDPALMILIHPEEPSTLLGAWLVFLIGAQLDTYQRKYRWGVMLAGLISAFGLFKYLYPEMTMGGIIFALTCMACFIFILHVMERFWLVEMVNYRKAAKREVEMEKAAVDLKVEATVGQHTKLIIHELNNITQILDYNASELGEVPQEEVNRAVDYIKKINGLFLLPGRKIEKRKVKVRALIDDINILARKYVISQQIRWELNLNGDKIEDRMFEEQPGVSYLIIYNLIKNACESLMQYTEVSPKIISIDINHEENSIVILVRDNGPGLNNREREKILQKQMNSSKKTGHGLGLKFCMDACNENNFTLTINSDLDIGCEFCVRIPEYTKST